MLNMCGFSSITQKQEKIFSSSLVTLFIVFTIKLEDRTFLVAKVMAQIKEVQK